MGVKPTILKPLPHLERGGTKKEEGGGALDQLVGFEMHGGTKMGGGGKCVEGLGEGERMLSKTKFSKSHRLLSAHRQERREGPRDSP